MSGVAKFKYRAIRWTGLNFPEFAERAFRTDGLVQTALLRTLVWWRQQIGPLHFEEDAYSRYGGKEDKVYSQRSPRYIRWKMRKWNHNKPLVMSGQLRSEFLRGVMKTRVTGADAGTLHGVAAWPGVNNLKRRGVSYVFAEHGRAPHKYAELTVLNEEDERALMQVFEKFLAEEIESMEQGAFVSADRVEQFAAEQMAPGAGFQG